MKNEVLEIISVKKLQGKDWEQVFTMGDMNQSIYPASISKIFVGAEVLRKVESGELNLEAKILMTERNIVDFDPLEFQFDKRPLLTAGDKVSIEFLLDLMLSRSDNSATNQLIDLVTRESINKNTILSLGMEGCEITRKYCPRVKEDYMYAEAPINMCTPLKIEKFFQELYLGKIHSKFVSEKLTTYLSHTTGIEYLSMIPEKLSCVYKGGSLKSILKDGRICMWKHSVMTVTRGEQVFSITMFTISKNKDGDITHVENKLRDVFRYHICIS